ETCKYRETRAAEDLADLRHDNRIAEIGLVGAVFELRRVIGDAREGRLRDGAAAAELLEDAGDDRLDRGEDVLLRHERHLEVELVELARRAVGAPRLVAEARRDLEVAIEARHHQELLELLRRLREGIE